MLPLRTVLARQTTLLMRRPAASDTVETLRVALQGLGLDTSGRKDTLLKRAKKAYSTRAAEQAAAASRPTAATSRENDDDGTTRPPARGYPGKFKAFLVFDVEGTCESGGKDYDYPNEVVEFPVVLLRWRTRPTSSNPFNQDLYIAASFQSYVRPTFKPQLSTFCTDLTGITQDTVDKAPKFEDVLQDFEQWLEDNGLDTKAKGDEKDWLWVTDGPWDLRDFITKQLYISRLKPSSYPCLSGPVLDLKTALHDRWKAELIRRTPESPITFPDEHPRVPPPLAQPLVPEEQEETPLTSEVEPSSPASSQPEPLPPSTPDVPTSPTLLRSSSPRFRRKVSSEAVNAPATVTAPPPALSSPLARALGSDRNPPRTVTQINRHLRRVLTSGEAHEKRFLTIPFMIRRLNMGQFEGPAHSGIVDAFNMARVVIHLSQLPPALRTVMLEPNMVVQQGSKVFAWMAGDGEVDLKAIGVVEKGEGKSEGQAAGVKWKTKVDS